MTIRPVLSASLSTIWQSDTDRGYETSRHLFLLLNGQLDSLFAADDNNVLARIPAAECTG